MTRTYDDPERYNGWANRETWAVALHINNDRGLQAMAHEILRDMLADDDRNSWFGRDRSGEVIQGWIEGGASEMMDDPSDVPLAFARMILEAGSLWRVDWTELGAAFLQDIAEGDA